MPTTSPPHAFRRRVAAAGLPVGTTTAPVTDDDIADLPPVVARYLRAMGVVGHPPTRSLQAHWSGRFRLGRDKPWLPCDAWQYNSALEIARLFRMRLLVGRVLPMWGWDTYRGGTGRMLGKALGLVTVADGKGPQFDIGELTTWLNDAVLLAPGMLLSAAVTWEATGDDSFRVSVADGGRTVSAEVFLDDGGRPRDFRSEDRYADLPGGPVRALWSTPVQGWTVVDGRPRITGGAAVWHLPDGEFRYGELRLLDLALDVPPDVAVRPLLGLRHRPGRLARAVFRMPLKAYEHGVGPAAGRTFLAFTHVGRKTGLPHQAVAMVLRYDTATEEAVVCAAWGPHTDWYRNLQAHPATQVQLGGRTFLPEQRFLSDDEAVEVVRAFRREHPHRLRFFSRVLGWGDLSQDDAVRDFLSGHPFVAFRPAVVPAAANAVAGAIHPDG